MDLRHSNETKPATAKAMILCSALALASLFARPASAQGIACSGSSSQTCTTANVAIGTTTTNPLSILVVKQSGYYPAIDVQEVGSTNRRAIVPATVVVLNRDKNNEVTASSHPYDTAVAGVVSARPGVILGEAAASKAQIATTGRVRVKVDATQQPIRVGDLLVTSYKSGMAMKSIPVVIGSIPIHRPGTLIGKALEPLTRGEGEILVLLSLQ